MWPDCYHSIPVFKKLSQTTETGRFWYAFAVGDDQVIIMGPGFTRLDLSYAVSFLATHPLLNHHAIACKNDEAAGVVDLRYIGDLKGKV
jgi:hypothetical protein